MDGLFTFLNFHLLEIKDIQGDFISLYKITQKARFVQKSMTEKEIIALTPKFQRFIQARIFYYYIAAILVNTKLVEDEFNDPFDDLCPSIFLNSKI